MNKSHRYTNLGIVVILAATLLCPSGMWAQDPGSANYERDAIISAAKELIKSARYCGLITLDESGHPQVRTMDPISPGKDMVVWLGTNKNSRKVREIRNDSRVSLYYEAPDGGGYVVIKGNASVVDDPGSKEKCWKEEWAEFYPDRHSTYALIRVVPERLEIISYKHGIVGSSQPWAVPHIIF